MGIPQIIMMAIIVSKITFQATKAIDRGELTDFIAIIIYYGLFISLLFWGGFF